MPELQAVGERTGCVGVSKWCIQLMSDLPFKYSLRYLCFLILLCVTILTICSIFQDSKLSLLSS